MALDGRAALLLVVALAAVQAQTDCYNVTHPSLEAHFDAGSALVRACRAAGDTGPNATTCHDPCLRALVTERQSPCFTGLQAAGHPCEDVFGLILSALSLQKLGIAGCRPYASFVCLQRPGRRSIPWHTVLPVATGLLLLAVGAVSAGLYYVDKMELHRYEVSDDEEAAAAPAATEDPDTPSTPTVDFPKKADHASHASTPWSFVDMSPKVLYK